MLIVFKRHAQSQQNHPAYETESHSLRNARRAAYVEAGFRITNKFHSISVNMYMDHVEADGQSVYVPKTAEQRKPTPAETTHKNAYGPFAQKAAKSPHDRGKDIGDGFRRLLTPSFLELMREEQFTTADGQTICMKRSFGDAFKTDPHFGQDDSGSMPESKAKNSPYWDILNNLK